MPLIYRVMHATQPHLIITVIIDHIEDLVEEIHLLSRHVNRLLLHRDVNTALVDIELAKHI